MVYAVAVSVCLSVCYRPVLHQKDWTNLVDLAWLIFLATCPTQCFKEIGVFLKTIWYSFLWIFVANFCHGQQVVFVNGTAC